jgi:hypothetical protein
MPIAPASLVVGAPRVALPFGLFSTFTLRDAGADRWESGVQFETDPCDPVDGIGYYDWCNPGATIGLPKDLAKNIGLVAKATPFTVYGHFQCSPTGWTPERAQDMATAHLLDREEQRVEKALATGDLGNIPNLFTDVDGVGTNPTILSNPDGVTPSFPQVALGLLENFIAQTYGSMGIIHMSRGAAMVLTNNGMLQVRGSRLTTMVGTPVAAGGGYPGTGPTGAPAVPALTAWIYATPAIFGYRSEVFTSSNVAGDLLDRNQNNLYAVAERNYLIGFDPCGVGAALVDLDA